MVYNQTAALLQIQMRLGQKTVAMKQGNLKVRKKNLVKRKMEIAV